MGGDTSSFIRKASYPRNAQGQPVAWGGGAPFQWWDDAANAPTFTSPGSPGSLAAASAAAPAGPPINAQSPNALLTGIMQGAQAQPGAMIGGLPANKVMGSGFFPATPEWDSFQAGLQAPAPRAAPAPPRQMAPIPIAKPAPAPMHQPTPVRPTRKRTISDESE